MSVHFGSNVKKMETVEFPFKTVPCQSKQDLSRSLNTLHNSLVSLESLNLAAYVDIRVVLPDLDCQVERAADSNRPQVLKLKRVTFHEGFQEVLRRCNLLPVEEHHPFSPTTALSKPAFPDPIGTNVEDILGIVE